ncbi:MULTISPECIES: ABC transporter substrate-binding protein [Microbacterium]|uniref:ABC transporter substrate-binding protein n=1 Tax=Microbacterium TaxID=33882 RepID=UPI00300FA063
MSKFTRTAAAAVAAAAVVGALAGCSSDGGSADGGDVTLEWGFWDQGSRNDVWKGLAADVTDAEPAISVNLSTVPFADYFTKLQSQLAAGTAPCIVSMQSLRLPAFKDALEPIGPLMEKAGFDESEWNPGALKALQVDGEQYAVPYGLGTLVLYYNKDMFAAAGIPEPTNDWSIEDFEAAAKTLTEKTGKPGFGESFSDLHMFSLLLANNGARPITDGGELDLTNADMKESFSWYSGLATDQKVALVPASASDVPWGEQQFVAGNVGMAVDGTWNIASDATDATFNVGVVALPQGANGGGTYSANSGFAISKTCEHKEEAAKAIAVLTGEEAQTAAAEGGTSPARLAPEAAFYEALAATVDTKTPGYSEQAKAVMTASSDMATPFISTAAWDQTTKLIAREFILAYTGSTSPDEALEKVQSSSK